MRITFTWFICNATQLKIFADCQQFSNVKPPFLHRDLPQKMTWQEEIIIYRNYTNLPCPRLRELLQISLDGCSMPRRELDKGLWYKLFGEKFALSHQNVSWLLAIKLVIQRLQIPTVREQDN